jgi:hypothetical protein
MRIRRTCGGAVLPRWLGVLGGLVLVVEGQRMSDGEIGKFEGRGRYMGLEVWGPGAGYEEVWPMGWSKEWPTLNDKIRAMGEAGTEAQCTRMTSSSRYAVLVKHSSFSNTA